MKLKLADITLLGLKLCQSTEFTKLLHLVPYGDQHIYMYLKWNCKNNVMLKIACNFVLLVF